MRGLQKRKETLPNMRQSSLDHPALDVLERFALNRCSADELEIVEKERKDLPQAYSLMFADFKTRLKSDDTREVRRIATSVLLALATPRLSSFMLNLAST